MPTDETPLPTRAQIPAVHERMLVFALRDGVLLHDRDVPTKKACPCIYPACSEPLIAVSQGKKRAAHFRPEAHADCAAGNETSLHLAGKKVLLRLKIVLLPAFRKRLEVQASDGTVFAETRSYPSRTLGQCTGRKFEWRGTGSGLTRFSNVGCGNV